MRPCELQMSSHKWSCSINAPHCGIYIYIYTYTINYICIYHIYTYTVNCICIYYIYILVIHYRAYNGLQKWITQGSIPPGCFVSIPTSVFPATILALGSASETMGLLGNVQKAHGFSHRKNAGSFGYHEILYYIILYYIYIYSHKSQKFGLIGEMMVNHLPQNQAP